MDILHRSTGAVLKTVPGSTLHSAYLRGADLGGAYLRGADLGGAYLRGADLRGADLRGAYLRGADLRGAYLRDADLGGADLRGADLRGAYLGGTDLGGTDLGGADLRGADLSEQWIIQGATRSDGYFFMLTNFTGKGVRVKAGCRNLTLKQAADHWNSTRANTQLGTETTHILNNLVSLAQARGYKLED